MKQYHIIYEESVYKDMERIINSSYSFYQEELINKIKKDIMSLAYMLQIHKTLIASNDKYGEYRRMVSGKYSIIYKIIKDEIMILRIFYQKEDYLNDQSFILKEESEEYIVEIRREKNMTRLKTLKNSYSKLKENFSRIITGKEVWSRYTDRLIEEAEESLKNEGYVTLEELREELIREYNVNI